MSSKRKPIDKNCQTCGSLMQNVNGQRKYCSAACWPSKEQQPSWIQPVGRKYGLSTGQVGALSELSACADLIRRGFEVFRAVSQHCTCDLIALKDGKASRIEVRTAYKKKNGSISYPWHTADQGRSDVLAMVVDGEPPIYKPDLT